MLCVLDELLQPNPIVVIRNFEVTTIVPIKVRLLMDLTPFPLRNISISTEDRHVDPGHKMNNVTIHFKNKYM